RTSACTFPAIFNVGDAVIKGIETELHAILVPGVQLDVAYSYTNARYESNVPQDNIYAGERIDGTPDSQADVGLEYDFREFSANWFARADVQYIGRMVAKSTDFLLQAQPFPIGEYATTAARIGASFADGLRIEAFINNAFNRYGVTRE